jgi:hypothetical protein
MRLVQSRETEEARAFGNCDRENQLRGPIRSSGTRSHRTQRPLLREQCRNPGINR